MIPWRFQPVCWYPFLSSAMRSVTNDNFGPIIAYLVPGLVVVVGFSRFSPTLRTWLAATPSGQPTIGGFLYITIASLAIGMTVSAVRWAFIDTLHAWTGLPPPRLDYSKLGENVTAYQLLIDIHYRHYLYYANMFVATAVAYVSYRLTVVHLLQVGWLDGAVLFLESVFLLTSRDTLRKYYTRSAQLLSPAGDRQQGKPDPAAQALTSRVPAPAAPQSPAGSDRASCTPFEAE